MSDPRYLHNELTLHFLPCCLKLVNMHSCLPRSEKFFQSKQNSRIQVINSMVVSFIQYLKNLYFCVYSKKVPYLYSVYIFVQYVYCKDFHNSCIIWFLKSLLISFKNAVFRKTFQANRSVGPVVCQNTLGLTKIYLLPFIHVQH